MRSGPASGGRATAAEPSSPELALVDHELAARARERLAPADDTIERLERAVALRRLTSLSEPVDEAHERPITPRATRPRATRRTVAATVAAALSAALLLGVEVDLRGNPAGADPSTETQAEPSTPAPTPAVVDSGSSPSRPSGPVAAGTRKSEGRSGSTSPQGPTTGKNRPGVVGTPQSEPTPRRFAWAPVSSATAYHVEFFRGSTRVYASRAAEPQLDLPRSWRFNGRAQRLSTGTYRWYVWPVRAGRRGTTATVQAELVVP